MTMHFVRNAALLSYTEDGASRSISMRWVFDHAVIDEVTSRFPEKNSSWKIFYLYS
jgi:hypothetical protein